MRPTCILSRSPMPAPSPQCSCAEHRRVCAGLIKILVHQGLGRTSLRKLGTLGSRVGDFDFADFEDVTFSSLFCRTLPLEQRGCLPFTLCRRAPSLRSAAPTAPRDSTWVWQQKRRNPMGFRAPPKGGAPETQGGISLCLQVSRAPRRSISGATRDQSPECPY